MIFFLTMLFHGQRLLATLSHRKYSRYFAFIWGKNVGPVVQNLKLLANVTLRFLP